MKSLKNNVLMQEMNLNEMREVSGGSLELVFLVIGILVTEALDRNAGNDFMDGWTADGNNVLIYDAYDWWKIDLTGERQPECFTKGYGRKNKRSIRKMTSNIDKEVFKPDETVVVSVWDENTMDEGIYSLDMKGRLKKCRRLRGLK